MSTTANATATIDRLPVEPERLDPRRSAPRPHIEVVPSLVQKRARPRLVYAIVATAGLLGIVAVQLLLSVSLSQGAYQIAGYQTELRTLDRSNADAQHIVDQLASPQNLAAAALGLGMVADTAPVYLRLSDGAVLGVPASATAAATGATENLVPNSLLTAGAAAAAAADEKAAAERAAQDASVAPAAGAGAAVPLQGTLTAPTTH